MIMQYGIEEKKQRWIDFMSFNKRPQKMYLIEYPELYPGGKLSARPRPIPGKSKERVEWAWAYYNKQLEKNVDVVDDAIPYLYIHTGTVIFAEALGCKLHYPENNMPFALSFINDASQVSSVTVPKLEDSTLTRLFEMTDELKARGGKDALMKLPDIQSPMDIVAQMWDKSNLYIAVIEEPEAVRELAFKAQELLESFLDEWFRRYGKEFIAHHPDYYVAEGITLTEDEVGIVSPQIFEDMFLPELVHLSTRYGRIGMHCCADARHQWESFKKIPNLCLLNISQQTRDTVHEAYDFFKNTTTQMHFSNRAQETKKKYEQGPPWTWLSQYPEEARVVMRVNASSKEEAVEISHKMWGACGRTQKAVVG